MAKFDDVWVDVEASLDEAKGISFDGCHKIYILLDDQQVKQSVEWGYGEDGSFLITDQSVSEMLATVKKWYADSCGLKFVQSVETVDGLTPDSMFDSIIPQGYEAEFCDYCDEDGADFDGVCSDCREEEDYEDYEDEDEDEDDESEVE